MYTMEYYSMIKKNNDIAIWKLQNTLLSEKSHTLHYFICMNFNNTELIYGERNETAFACGGGGGSGGGGWMEREMREILGEMEIVFILIWVKIS